ncbi:MAG: glycoside hydrolase family 16 protein [Steroidobacterales bacterium]
MLLAGGAALAAIALATVPSAHADPPARGCWTLAPSASDDFISFDSSKWTKALWYADSGVGAFNPANVTVTGGELALTAKLGTYNGMPYTFGAVESKFDIPGAASYVEVRAKVLDSAANVLSAIWMQTSPLTQANNPNPEIDIEETFTYDQLISSLHRWIVPITDETHLQDAHERYSIHVADISKGYHVYGLERSKSVLRFYFDKQLAGQITPPHAAYFAFPRHLVLSLEGHLGQPVDAHLPATFRIDYVHTYVPCR